MAGELRCTICDAGRGQRTIEGLNDTLKIELVLCGCAVEMKRWREVMEIGLRGGEDGRGGEPEFFGEL